MTAFPSPAPGIWPPDYRAVFEWRQMTLLSLRSDPVMLAGAHEYYRQPQHCADWIEHWCTTYDPRNAGMNGKLTTMPFVLFQRQKDFVEFVLALIEAQTNGQVEKCRDVGATWLAGAVSAWLWRYLGGASVGWGSRKEQLVDKLGDADSIFEKIRIIIRLLPPEFLPVKFDATVHMPFMRIINPETGATITGEAGDNIGRGGRKLIFFKDESAHYERAEKIEAALSETTRVQVDISSVNGVGNVFHNKRKAGVIWEPGKPAIKNKNNVFIFDWRDHPERDQKWYDDKRAAAEEVGMLAGFAQEVDRDYAASVEGIIIRPEWVKASIDADKVLGFTDEGPEIGGFDVADGVGRDQHAAAVRKGPILKKCHAWPFGDAGQAARTAIGFFETFRNIEVNYDSIGVGAAVKSETNRLKSVGQMPKGMRWIAWAASAKVLFPDKRVNPLDRDSMLNADYFANLKAQGWWQLQQRFYKTWRAVHERIEYDPGELISIPKDMPERLALEEELSQAVFTKSTSTLKWLVDKTPNDTRSPNRADAVVMAYWPIPSGALRYSAEILGV